MDKKCSRTVLGIAVIWAAVIFASAFVLKGEFIQLIPIYGAGAIMCILLTGNLCNTNK